MRNLLLNFIIIILLTGCHQKVEIGDLNAEHPFGNKSWGLPDMDFNRDGKWVMRTHNHVLSLILYFSATQSEWAELTDQYKIEPKPASGTLNSDIMKAISFSEECLSKEIENFNASEYITPLANGYRNFIMYDMKSEKCILYFRK